MAFLDLSPLSEPWGREPRLSAQQPVASELGKLAGGRREPRTRGHRSWGEER